MNTTEQIEIVESHVRKYVMENLNLLPYTVVNDSDSLGHVFSIAQSIMCTKWKIGYPGGSFVQSIVNNDLRGSFANADLTNRQCVYFYVVMMDNLGMPRELW
jgi:hypothetical protein